MAPNANEKHPIVEKILSRLMDVVPESRAAISKMIPELRAELKKHMPEAGSNSLQAALATAQAKIEELEKTLVDTQEDANKNGEVVGKLETELADHAKQIDALKKQLTHKDLASTDALVKIGQLQAAPPPAESGEAPEPAAPGPTPGA